MASKDYSEDALIQAPTADFLAQQLGWETVFAQDEGGFGPDSLLGRVSDREVVLSRDVMAALRRLNPGLPEAAYAQALSVVLQDDATQSLVKMNEAKYRLLRDGVLVKVRDAGGKLVERRLRLIDFDTPANNRYLAVRELWVRGSLWLRRPDIIGFVNGLPLVFIELKRFEVHIDSAYKKNYADYLDTIPHLFHWNALVVISNGHDAQYGSITSSRDHFYRWKRLDEDDPEPKPEQPLLPLLLAGMLDRVRLLDIVENFMLFDAGEETTQKIVARNHQYLGVNRVIERLTSTDPKVKAEVDAGQLGVFWHTQGSGKSYSMLFLTEKVRRRLSGSYTFVVVTDRSELDDQIAGTYTSAGRANSKTDQAKNGDALRRMLRDQNRHYVFGLIQKYRERVAEPYSMRDDIIVISDEAHRTQYGRLALNMRKGLPRAKFLGFTGTPLIDDGEKQLTRQVFGDYVSIYDFKRAVADGATLPLFYENRGEKLKIVDPKVSERLAQHIEAAKLSATAEDPWTDEKEDKLYRELARDYPILTAPTRLDKVATDFVEHYHQRWQVVAGGASKALVVCLDKITCVKLHDLIEHKWQALAEKLDAQVAEEEALFAAKGKAPSDLLKTRRAHVVWMLATEICVVVSQEQGEVADFAKWKNFRDEPLAITPHREKMVKRNLEHEFKKPENPICYRKLRRTSAGRLQVDAQVQKSLLTRGDLTYEVQNVLLDLPRAATPEYSIEEPTWTDSWKPFVHIPDRLASSEVFTGRAKEMSALADWADDPDSRKCMVWGDGGVGKTTLVVEFLHRLLEGSAGVEWRPELITFYTAKKTRWGLQGLPPASLAALQPAARWTQPYAAWPTARARCWSGAWWSKTALALVARWRCRR